MNNIFSIILISLFMFSCISFKKTIEIPYYYTEYQLEKFNDLYLINVTLNGKKTKLLIDTGATKSLLDISKSKQFNFEYSLFNRNKYIGLGGLTDIYVVYNYTIDSFFIPFLGSDLEEINNYFNKDGNKIVGIIGSDFLLKNGAIIDYTTNKLYLNTNGININLKICK